MQASVLFLVALPLAAQGTGVLTGRILDALTNNPVRNARVIAQTMGATANDPATETRSNDEGIYRFSALPPAAYVVYFEKSGYLESNTRFALRDLKVRAGETTADKDILLFPHAVIAGRVLDAAGDPLAGASVRVVPFRRLGNPVRVTTDDRGQFRAPGLLAGEYIVSAERMSKMAPLLTLPAEGERLVDATTYYPSASDPAATTPIRIGQGESREDIEIRLRRVHAVRIAGTLSGLPDSASPARLELHPQSRAAMFDSGLDNTRRESAGQTGGFQFPLVPAGVYDLIAQSYAEGKSWFGMAKIVASASDIDNVAILLRPSGTVEVKLRPAGETAALPKKLALQLSPHHRFLPGRAGTAGSEGTSTIPEVGPGVYTLSDQTWTNWYIRSISHNGVPLPGLTIDFTNGHGTLELTVSGKPATVSGTVTLPSNFVGHAFAFLYPAGAEGPELPFRIRQAIATSGAFQIRGLAPGKYKLLVVSTGLNSRLLIPGFLDRVKDKIYDVLTEEGVTTSIEARLVQEKDVDPN